MGLWLANRWFQDNKSHSPVAVGMVGFFALLLLSTNAQAERHGVCCNTWVVIDDAPRTAGLDTQWNCQRDMKELKPELKAAACRKLQSIKKPCPEVSQNCAPNNCTPPTVPYTGSIACDCDGDGKDDNTKSFESCGPPEDKWPPSFQSRCEDWIRSEGGYGFGTDIAIQHAGRDYLESLKCPALKCHREYQACESQAKNEYEKCSFKRDFIGLRERCLNKASEAGKKCQEVHDTCLKNIL